MKCFLTAILFTLTAEFSFGQNKVDGFYFGIDPNLEINNQVTPIAGHTTPQKFHKTFYLKIKKDSAFLDTKYADIIGKDTTTYSSDGIYEYFDGTVMRKDASTVNFELKEVVVNYFEQFIQIDKDGVPQVIRRQNQFSGKLVADGILIKGILLKRVPENIKLISENPQLLNNHVGTRAKLKTDTNH